MTQNDFVRIFNENKQIMLSPLTGGVIAVALNLVLFLIFSGFNTFPNSVLLPLSKLPISFVDIILASFIPSILAIPLLLYLYRSSNNPFKLFTFLTFGVLAISMIFPATLDYAPIQMIVALEIMHIVAALSIYSAVSRAVNNLNI